MRFPNWFSFFIIYKECVKNIPHTKGGIQKLRGNGAQKSPCFLKGPIKLMIFKGMRGQKSQQSFQRSFWIAPHTKWSWGFTWPEIPSPVFRHDWEWREDNHTCRIKYCTKTKHYCFHLLYASSFGRSWNSLLDFVKII